MISPFETCSDHRTACVKANNAIIKSTPIMGAVESVAPSRLKNYDCTRYQATHIQGGTTMGKSPENSVLNRWLQHWDVSNLFVPGASSFPQNASRNPTLTILAQTYRTAVAIVIRYLRKPGHMA